MAEESGLVKALEEEVVRSQVLVNEIESSRNLILEMLRCLVAHPRVGQGWRVLFDKQVLGDIEKIKRGSYLTKEVCDGEDEDGGTA